MATDTPPTTHGGTERCPECRGDTPHSVAIEIRTEATDSANAAFSREPYRVAECLDCGHERATRMNNAAPN